MKWQSEHLRATRTLSAWRGGEKKEGILGRMMDWHESPELGTGRSEGGTNAG